MIEVYSWPTPNGHKVHIMLEECRLPYRVIPVDIGAGEQFDASFLAISPNNKIPAIVDPDGPDGDLLTLDDNDWHLVDGAPGIGLGWDTFADDCGTYDNLVSCGQVADDHEGRRRGASPTIGAYEVAGP